MTQEQLTLYEKNLNAIKLNCPDLYREFKGIIDKFHPSAEGQIVIEPFVGKRGHPTFTIKARVRKEFGANPLEFSIVEYRKTAKRLSDEIASGRSGSILNSATDAAYPPVFKVVSDIEKQAIGHSIFDPVRESQKKFGNERLEENERVVMLGIGFGYELRELLRISEHKVIVVVEPFPELFKAALENVDMTDIFSSGRVVLTFSLEPSILQYHLLAGVSHLTIPNFTLRALPHASLCPRLVSAVSAARREASTFLLFNLMTGIVAGPKLQMNTVFNSWAAMRSPGVNILKDSFKDKAVIVVAPGPSLEKNVHELKRAKGKALIIACDTATRILLKHGVESDVVVTIDYQPLNFLKLRGVDTSFAYLFPSLEVTPYAPMNHTGRMFTYYHNDVSERLFTEILGNKGLVKTGGSVLTDAFSIARHMGANPIILAGVDLGFPGMRWYAEGSYEEGKFTDNLRANKVDMIEIEDVFGNPMITYKSFYEFLKWFKKTIRTMGNTTVVDATEGGAKIEGSLIMTMSDAIDKYVAQGDPPVSVLDRIYESYLPPSNSDMLVKLDELNKDYVRIIEELKAGIKYCSKAKGTLKQGGEVKGNKKLIHYLKKINETKTMFYRPEFENRLSFVSTMMERQMADILFYSDKSDLPMKDKIDKLVDLDDKFYKKAEKACENMITHLEYIREGIILEEDNAEYV
ncbi:MAG TPA: DUF115 domain-containing protein [bacterium]|nr:DUF115 domain-containing protein [bacterium]